MGRRRKAVPRILYYSSYVLLYYCTTVLLYYAATSPFTVPALDKETRRLPDCRCLGSGGEGEP